MRKFFNEAILKGLELGLILIGISIGAFFAIYGAYYWVVTFSYLLDNNRLYLATAYMITTILVACIFTSTVDWLIIKCTDRKEK